MNAILQKAILLIPYARWSDKYVPTATPVNNMLYKNLNMSFKYVLKRSILSIYSTSTDTFFKPITQAALLKKNLSNTMKYSKINPQGVPQQPKTCLVFLLTQSLCSIGNFSSTGVKKTTRSSGGALYLQHATARVCVCMCVQVRAHLTCQSHKLRTQPYTDVCRNWRTPNTTITEVPCWT
jgi:hypothetical protein